jgi:response regulator RpfG family c-di-GMP phosphodiesterase
MKHKILIVDDEPANLRMLERLFREDYEPVTAGSGAEAIEMLSHFDVAVIISDQRMPGMTGIEFLQRAAEMRQQTVRIILTGYTDVADLVAAINSGVIYKYITKPWVNVDLMQTVQRAVEHYEATKNQHQLALENDRLENRVQKSVQGCVKVIREVIAQKSSNLSEHCRRTSEFAALIGTRFKLDTGDMERLIFASLLHELPNIRIPFEMDFEKTALTPEQHRMIRANYESGLRLISNVPDLEEVATIISYQHEHYDGTGFFNGLAGDTIPLMSRILAVANAFDEINSGRNPALFCTDEEAAIWLRKRAGTKYDPRVVEACLEMQMIEAIGFPSSVRFRGSQTEPTGVLL